MPPARTDIEHTATQKVAEAISLVRFRGVSIERAAAIVCHDIESIRKELEKDSFCLSKLYPDIPTPEDIATACLRFRELFPRKPVGFDPSQRIEISQYSFHSESAEFCPMVPDSP